MDAYQGWRIVAEAGGGGRSGSGVDSTRASSDGSARM